MLEPAAVAAASQVLRPSTRKGERAASSCTHSYAHRTAHSAAGQKLADRHPPEVHPAHHLQRAAVLVPFVQLVLWGSAGMVQVQPGWQEAGVECRGDARRAAGAAEQGWHVSAAEQGGRLGHWPKCATDMREAAMCRTCERTCKRCMEQEQPSMQSGAGEGALLGASYTHGAHGGSARRP